MPTSGKTTLAQELKEHFIGEEYHFVSMDEVREQVWGSKKRLTDTEHVYKNRLTERVAQDAFIVHEATCVFYDAVMLTREQHQKPLMRMVMDTEAWLSRIRTEKLGSLANVKIQVKAVWLTCPPEIVEQRLKARFEDPEGLHSVNMDAWHALQQRFEPIKEFPYRQFDTSVITLEDLVQEVIQYIQE